MAIPPEITSGIETEPEAQPPVQLWGGARHNHIHLLSLQLLITSHGKISHSPWHRCPRSRSAAHGVWWEALSTPLAAYTLGWPLLSEREHSRREFGKNKLNLRDKQHQHLTKILPTANIPKQWISQAVCSPMAAHQMSRVDRHTQLYPSDARRALGFTTSTPLQRLLPGQLQRQAPQAWYGDAPRCCILPGWEPWLELSRSQVCQTQPVLQLCSKLSMLMGMEKERLGKGPYWTCGPYQVSRKYYSWSGYIPNQVIHGSSWPAYHQHMTR